MKQLPQVLIMGRPNVGKSTLINRLLGRKKSITLDVPGVTRDLSAYPMDWNGKPFMVVDSGGIMLGKHDDDFQHKVEAMVMQALESAHAVIFVTDFSFGVHASDMAIAKVLREYHHKVILVVNKVDDPTRKSEIAEFYKLGLGQPTAISSIHGHGLGDILDRVTKNMTKVQQEDDGKTFRVAFVGRPNVGKSSLLNAILNEDRVIVDSVAGTTRDSIEAYFNTKGNRFIFVDTAGMRKKAKVEDGIEYYSVIRSTRAIHEADLVVVLINPEPFLSDQDRKIINQVLESKKNMIIFVNKWDETERTDAMRSDLVNLAIHEMPVLAHFPFIFGSAKEKIHLGKLFELIPVVVERSKVRIPTPKLNTFITNIIKRNPPPARQGRRIKVFYGTQAESSPPFFVFFVSEGKLIEADYQRFVEKRLREEFPFFEGVPIQLFFKTRRKVVLD
jgi:GTP-binding protein